MREIWARRIVLLTALLVLALAYLFARMQNPSNVTKLGQDKTESRVAAGRKIYLQQHCGRCHAIGGEGNPRYSLDDVGSRFSPVELRQYVTGDAALRGRLPENVRKMKQTYRQLPAADMDALLVYLQSLHS